MEYTSNYIRIPEGSQHVTGWTFDRLCPKFSPDIASHIHILMVFFLGVHVSIFLEEYVCLQKLLRSFQMG